MGIAADISVTWAQALSWRMSRQLLEPVGSGSVADVVRRLGAVLSMDRSLAELAVRTRAAASEPGDLAAALASGEVVDTYSYRGSMHYMAPEDAGIYLSLRQAGRQWELPSWVEFYRLGPDDWPDFRAAVRDALADGPLSVGDLGRALVRRPAYRHLAEVFEDGAGTLIKPLAWQGDLSFGPPRDGRRMVQRVDTNPRWGGIPDLEDAGPRAITAYVQTYGPATSDHLHYWFGNGLSAGRKRIDRWIAGLGDALVEVDVEGATALVVRDDVPALLAAAPSDAVRLLPGHDQWVIGPGTKDEHVTPAGLRQLMTRKANPVVVGGVVCGTWARTGDEVVVTWLDERPLPRAAVEREVERLGELVGLDLRLGP